MFFCILCNTHRTLAFSYLLVYYHTRAPTRKTAASVSGAAGNSEQVTSAFRPRITFDTYLEALKRYKEVHGHMLVSRFFVVPEGDAEGAAEWPAHLQGMKLGCLLREVKRGRSHQSRKEELRALGFDLDCKGMGRNTMGGAPKQTYEFVKGAFLQYKEIHGDLLVPSHFVVPEGPEWPQDLWGVELGQYTQEIRQGVYLKHKKSELEEIGFVFENQVCMK